MHALMPEKYPWNTYPDYLEKNYGYRIWRVGVDAGFSCPNRGKDRQGGCVYCDALGAVAAYQKTYDGTASRTSDIKKQIERGRSFLTRRYGAEHFALYFQAFSNTFAPVAVLKEIYDSALEGNTWDSLIVSTRPDCVDASKVALLASYKERGLDVCVELGLQSGNDGILKAMNRGHDVQCFLDAARLVRDSGLELCVHVLLGFPGEGRAELDDTVRVFNQSGAAFIKIHNLNIAKDTVLYENYLLGKASAPDAPAYMQSVSYLLRRISPSVTVERLLCETPAQRLVSPKEYPAKNNFMRMLASYMNENGFKQGDLYQ